MQALQPILDWFSGGDPGYMTLWHCMRHDTFWVALTVALDLAVAAGYILIAVHWNRNQARLINPEARAALGRLRNIFIFCGLCGYLFVPMKMFWPAWRLYDFFMIGLVYFTWRYAWGAQDLKVIYRELGRAGDLGDELAASQAESQHKTRFLNAVSHDLRNPLYAMSLQSELAEAHLEGGDLEEAREAMTKARLCAAEASALLKHVLDLGRLEWSSDPLELDRVSGEEIARHAASLIEPAAREKGLAVQVQVERDARIRTDRGKLDRVLGNLLQNAVKYTQQGTVRIVAGAEGDAATFEVIDTGPGISAAHRERLFEDFYQADNPERDRRKGYGLGLSIARRLVEQMGGSIEVDTQVGRGSRFIVMVPDTRRAEAAGNGDGNGLPKARKAGRNSS